jgi:hypothetical protein
MRAGALRKDAQREGAFRRRVAALCALCVFALVGGGAFVDADDAEGEPQSVAIENNIAGGEPAQPQPDSDTDESKNENKNEGKKESEKKSLPTKEYKTKVKATWYTGDVLGFRGSYGKLTHGDTVALNAAQRSELGVDKKETVYLAFPEGHDNLSGRYKVMDSGCSSGVVDLFYKSKSSVPKKFRRAGVVREVKLYRYG